MIALGTIHFYKGSSLILERFPMFTFAPGCLWYPRVGFALMLMELALFVFGLPPFHTGIWLQTEPDMTAMFAFAALDCGWILTGLLRGWLRAQRPTLVWWSMAAWVGWQFIPTVFGYSVFRSWFGPVEMGEGMGWYTAMFVFMCKAIPLWQVPQLRLGMVWWSAIVIGVEALLHVIFNQRTNVYIPNVWIPAQWAAYLAYMAGYVWVMAMVAGYMRRPAMMGLLIFFLMDIIVVSYNKTGIVLMPLAFGLSLAMYLHARRHNIPDDAEPSLRSRNLAILCCLLPMLWVGLAAVYKAEDTGDVTDSLLGLSHKDGSLGSRVGLNQVALSTMAHEPRRWLIGAGWGDFNDSMFKYALVDGVRMFYKGERKPNWMFVDGNAYHSHCQPLEALLSLGLPGMILWFAMPIILIRQLKGQLFWMVAPVIVAMNGISFMWFILPQCVPMCGLMWAALSVACRKEEKAPSPKQRMVGIVLASIGVIVMTLSVQQEYQGMMFGERVYKGTRSRPASEFPLSYMLTDVYRGGDRLRVSAMGYGLSLDGERGDVDTRQRDWYALMMDAGEVMMNSPYIGPRSGYLYLWTHYKLLLNLGYPNFAELGERAVHDMPDAIMKVTRSAPLRDDIASFFFLNIDDVVGKDKVQQERIYRDILKIAPGHRSAKWMLGHLLLEKPGGQAEGEALIREAVAAEVWRVYPVTDEQMARWR